MLPPRRKHPVLTRWTIVTVNSSNEQRFANRLRQAWDQHQAGQLAAAGRVYRELLTEAPDDPDLNNLAGLLQLQTGQPGLAEKLIRRALQAEPGNPQSHYNLGMAYKDQHKWKEAAEAFQACVDLAPDNDFHQLSFSGVTGLHDTQT